MNVIQVYLPTVVTESIQFNGLTTPLLRYYERLVAVHLAPVLYKEISMSGKEKALKAIKRKFKQWVLTSQGDRVLASLIMSALGLVGTALGFKGAKKLVGKRESVELLENDNDKDKGMFTQIKFGKDYIFQFIALPLSINDVLNIFNVAHNPKLQEELKRKAFVSIKSLGIDLDLSVDAILFTVPAVICTVDEVDDIKKKYPDNEKLSLIVVDAVNEVVYTKIVIKEKVFRYSTPLNDVVRKQNRAPQTLSDLASILQGTRIASQI